MRPFPDNPFRPGFGTPPPVLAGRDHEKRNLCTLLRRLLAGELGSEAILLHGPRGNGKTALLQWLQFEAGDKVNLRRITAKSVTDSMAVVTDLLGSHRDESREETTHGIIGGGVPGVLRGEGSRQLTRRQEVFLSTREAMKQAGSKKPLLMMMDEAHTADPAGLGMFLNAFQDCAAEVPMRLVLAGTPDVQDVLSATDASFVDRIRRLPIGLLTPAAGHEAIAAPLTDHGIDSADGVVAHLAAWADNYPYFLQVVGEAVWTEVFQGEAHAVRLTRAAGEAAIERARVTRAVYYSTRYEELAAAGYLEFGVAVARAVCVGDQRIRKVDVEEIARQYCGEGWSTAVDFTVQKGFLWRAGAEREYQPGIPSLMRYTIREYEYDRSTPGQEAHRTSTGAA